MQHGDAERWWRDNHSLSHIVPPGTGVGPEDFNVCVVLRGLIGSGSVLDFGCGVGRLARCFAADRYIGVDVNTHALDYCRKHVPTHTFMRVDAGPLPRAHCVLAYTVLLHIPDAELPSVVERLSVAAPRVLVVEILGRQWRGKPGSTPATFNRELSDYASTFDAVGMPLHRAEHYPYKRYGGVSITAMDFQRASATT